MEPTFMVQEREFKGAGSV